MSNTLIETYNQHLILRENQILSLNLKKLSLNYYENECKRTTQNLNKEHPSDIKVHKTIKNKNTIIIIKLMKCFVLK